ncbi:MAG: OmpA family protein [Rudaea sp.]
MNALIKCCAAALMFCVAASCFATSEDGKDCEGCSDSGLFARYPGAILFGADQKEFEEAIVAVGPASKNDAGDKIAPQTLTLTGKRTRAFYLAPAQRSGLEVFANYRAALEKAGMNVVWSCSNDDQCGPEFLDAATRAMHLNLTGTVEAQNGLALGEAPRFLLAKQARPQGSLHVAVFVADIPANQRAGIYVIQIEEKPMDNVMAATQANAAVSENKQAAGTSVPMTDALVQAAALGSNLASTGQVNVYGIHFDFDKAEIKPESKPQLDEIAKLLVTNPTLKLRVTGHTDNIGSVDHNQTLSQRRADAIVAVLAANYGIVSERLTAVGLGSSLPVAGNDSDVGRALNRRVELVKQ